MYFLKEMRSKSLINHPVWGGLDFGSGLRIISDLIIYKFPPGANFGSGLRIISDLIIY